MITGTNMARDFHWLATLWGIGISLLILGKLTSTLKQFSKYGQIAINNLLTLDVFIYLKNKGVLCTFMNPMDHTGWLMLFSIAFFVFL